MTDYSELKRLAEAATPGPWALDGIARVAGDQGAHPNNIAFTAVFDDMPRSAHNAAYIAAANPAVILAILAELDALRVEAETLRRQNYQRKTSGLRERSHKPIVYRGQV